MERETEGEVLLCVCIFQTTRCLLNHNIQAIQQGHRSGKRKPRLFEHVVFHVDVEIPCSSQIRGRQIGVIKTAVFEIGILQIGAGQVRLRKIDLFRFAAQYFDARVFSGS